jgi:hypothetical protein
VLFAGQSLCHGRLRYVSVHRRVGASVGIVGYAKMLDDSSNRTEPPSLTRVCCAGCAPLDSLPARGRKSRRMLARSARRARSRWGLFRAAAKDSAAKK